MHVDWELHVSHKCGERVLTGPQPDHETLICDIEDLCQKLSPDLSPELRLSIEQKILVRDYLTPECHVALVMA